MNLISRTLLVLAVVTLVGCCPSCLIKKDGGGEEAAPAAEQTEPAE